MDILNRISYGKYGFEPVSDYGPYEELSLNCFQGAHRVFGFLQINLCDQPWFWVVGALENQILFFALKPILQHTNCEARKAQNPEVSADKICIWPVSRMRMPRHTSASHILLYSHAFFIKLCLRRHRFWRIDFLLAKVVDRVELKTAGRLAP